jgi:hypothetical protein
MANTPAVDLRGGVVRANRLSATSATGPAVVHGGGISNGGQLDLRETSVSDNVGTATGPTGEAQGGGIWNGAFAADAPAPVLTLLATSVTANVLNGGPGVSRQGGGLFTTVPITLNASTIAQNAPDQCFGC